MVPIKLRPISRENWRDALKLTVLPEQQAFVADHQPVAAIILSKAYVREAGATWNPYAFYAGTEMVGLVAHAHEPEKALHWIFHFFIDHRFQGRGHGKAALQRLLDRIRAEYPPDPVVQLSVHPENDRARNLYLDAGFTVTDIVLWGEQVYRMTLRS